MATSDTFTQLLELEPTLRGWAERFAAPYGQTEDLLQETYLRCWAGWDSYEDGSNLRGWAYTIMRNIWIDWQRRPRTALPIGLPADVDDLGKAVTVDYYPEGVNPVQLLVEAADSVPAEFLEVLLRLDVDGHLRQDIAVDLGIAEGTVSSRAHRARLILRQRLEELATHYQLI